MKILITDGMQDAALDMLREKHEVDVIEASPEELLDIIGNYEGICVRSRTKVTAEVIEKGEKLKVIGRAGVGTDNIDKVAASAKGIKVVNAPTGNMISVAELAMGHILALARFIPKANAGMHEGKWEKKQLLGMELEGKVLGLLGCGRIGTEVANRARAFGMTVIAYDPYLPARCFEEISAECIGECADLYANADFLSIHTALTPETKGMVGAAEFDRMKPTAYLVNCARGGIVDEDALYDALKEGKIAGAATDVFAEEPNTNKKLEELDNLIMTPHIGASTLDAQVKAGTITAGQMLMVLDGQDPEHWVNRPQ